MKMSRILISKADLIQMRSCEHLVLYMLTEDNSDFYGTKSFLQQQVLRFFLKYYIK